MIDINIYIVVIMIVFLYWLIGIEIILDKSVVFVLYFNNNVIFVIDYDILMVVVFILLD